MPDKPVKKVVVKTQARTYSAVRLSMVIMTATAMLSTGIIAGALLVAALPKSPTLTSGTSAVRTSANGAVGGEVLVRFKAGTNELARLRTIQAALQKPVDITTLQTVKQRVGLRTVTKTVEVVSKKAVTAKSLTPVVSADLKLANLGFDKRLARGAAGDVSAAADTLKRWYVLRVEPATANLTQVVSALAAQGAVEKAETNRFVQAAQVSRSATAGVIKLTDAQAFAYPASGDCNLDNVVDAKDLIVLVNYLFKSGPAPKSMLGCDANRDGKVNILDITAMVASYYASLTASLKDLTGDGAFTSDDLNFLSNYLFKNGPAPVPLTAADYNGDGSVDILDLTFAVDKLYRDGYGGLNYGRGDANADGVVDARDLDYLTAYLFTNGPAPSPLGLADMNLDGKVNILDLTILVNSLTRRSGVTGAALTKTTSTVTNLNGVPVQTITAIPYLLGDANGDGRVNTTDLSFFVAWKFQNGPAPSPLGRLDMNGDGSTDILDLTQLVRMLYNALAGRLALADLNSDGVVNAADMTVLSNYLFKNGVAPDATKADVNNDGLVNILDLTAMAEHVYRSQPVASCTDVRTVGGVTFLNGDLDGNGNVNILDLAFLVDVVYRARTAPAPTDRGDVNCDGLTNAVDVITLSDKLFPQPAGGPTLTGDANADGVIDTHDLDFLTAYLFTSGPAPSPLALADLNLDGKVNILDLTALVRLLQLNTVTKPLPDLNGDGTVTFLDAELVIDNVFTKGATVSITADINGDGKVDAADAIIFANTLADQQATTSVIVGDANADNLVDCRDAEFLSDMYFKSGPKASPATRGDVNGDGTANQADLLLLARRACPGIGAGDLATDVTVALIDTGVSNTSVDIQSALAVSKETAVNKKDDDGNGYVDDITGINVVNTAPVTVDCNGHGTALTRLLSTKAGIASWAQVVPIKALDCKGRGNALTLANALVYATIRGSDIAELPVSGMGTSTLLADIVKYAKASGMFVVAAAGNDAGSVSRVFPANVAGVFAVGATTATGTSQASYSNTGAPVSAPGNATGVPFQGTSVSATYVAGTAALVLTKTPTLTLTQLTAKLTPKPPVNAKNPKLLDAATAVGKN